MAVAVVAAALLVLAASRLPAAAAAPMALPNCPAACGEVSVPYPFGFTPGCHWPGLNLTCDATHRPPRLLLGTLRVVGISLEHATVRVTYSVADDGGAIVSNSTTDDGWSSFPLLGGLPAEHGYLLSSGNDLVLAGCNVVATLVAADARTTTATRRRGTTPRVITGCTTFCTMLDDDDPDAEIQKAIRLGAQYKHCTGGHCCHSPLNFECSPSGGVQVRWLYGGNHTAEQKAEPVKAFVAEEGWIELNGPAAAAREEVPLVLSWGVARGLPAPQTTRPVVLDGECTANASRVLCKSDHSNCRYSNVPQQRYLCFCQKGYEGNPYLAGGCQDTNECENPHLYDCFGVCINKIGSYECRCPRGTHGDPTQSNGCVAKSSATGVIIGIAVGSGAGSILLVVIAIFMFQRFKRMRETKLKQKFFKQNRGQLLQQLVSQRADIAERMIIPVEELAKATNNFDRARELGGGGHGTVYKGILSDLHVVAIKKSKISVQKEIDEFINEVAILSQINHRNIVKLFGCCLETEVPLLVYEFISNGTLYHHLHVEGIKSISWGTRLRIATETSSALAYLHSSVSTPIIYRDIKSSNILLDDMLTSKVSDFGASRHIHTDKTGLTTRVQGTVGYLDPMYFYTGRLTEKSDVYSFGILLVELLTRKKPSSYVSSDGEGLVAHFVSLIDEENLVQILDPQVIEEGGKQIQEVVMLAASCVKLSGEDRPTMREVQHTLEGLQSFKKYVKGNMATVKFEENDVTMVNYPSTKESHSTDEYSRRYSLEQELMVSARYPR